MATLRIAELRKRFGETLAVDGLSLDVAEGEFVSLLGPSGCGKSTTLALVAGFERPDDGAILVDDRRIEHLPPRQRPVGVVLQDFAIFPRLSVAENIAFGLAARGVGRAERDRRVRVMAERLRISTLLAVRGRDLDLADMQRVAIARTVVTEPSILLLDEPLSSLDATVREALRDELKALQSAIGQTVLYVTHDQSEALALSDRVAVMSGGRILQIDVPRALYERPADRFVASFVGEPPINILPASLHADADGTLVRPEHFPPFRWRAHWDGPEHVLLAVRPHGIAAGDGGTDDTASGEVVDIESYGAVTSLVALVDAARVNVAAGNLARRIGTAVALRLDAGGSLLIDPASQRTLARIDAADLS